MNVIPTQVTPSKSTEKIGLCNLTSIQLSTPGIDLGTGGRDAPVVSHGSKDTVLAFEFHKRQYLWDAGEKKFGKVYPAP